ncbi:extracellular matrix protein 2 [Chiloscyllium plagiosum]|uniref:extracellular matrix protein 2 n=1 Tax=Chiloscyllium plagiosum TaxID=36176 RepID=UPI001CB80F64|nr:extracellular matrix protein 2 [Chiloscyllium plagiosum]
MKVNFVLFFVLLNFCVIIGKREIKATNGSQWRQLHPQGQQVGIVNRNPARQSIPRRPLSPAKVPNMNADEGTATFLDSYIGIDETETSYNVLPGRQGRCKTNGMIMYDKAVWSPKPCLTCLCSNGKVICDEMNCPILKCARTTIPTGECCPICTSIELNDPSETYHPVIPGNQDTQIIQEELRRDNNKLEEELRRKDEEKKRKLEEKKHHDEEEQMELGRSYHRGKTIEEEDLQKLQAEDQEHLYEEVQGSKENGENQQLENEMTNHSKTIQEKEEQDSNYDGYVEYVEYTDLYDEEEEQQVKEQEEQQVKEQEEQEEQQVKEQEKQEEQQVKEQEEQEEQQVKEQEEQQVKEQEEQEEQQVKEQEEQQVKGQEKEEEKGEKEKKEMEEQLEVHKGEEVMEKEKMMEEVAEEEVDEAEMQNEKQEETQEEAEEKEIAEDEENGSADVFELSLFPSIFESILVQSGEEPHRFSLPVGCETTDITINCNNAKLTQIPPLSDLELTNLYLAGNRITAIPAGAFNGFPNLKLIDLSRNKILSSNIDPTAFKGLKKLERLYMDQNLLIYIPPQLPRKLVELKVNDNLLQRLDEEALQGLSKLVNLELEGNKLSESNVQPLVFRPLKRLAYLRLGNNKFRTLPQGLPTSIEELYLEDNEIEEISEVSLNKTTNLNVMVLRNNKLDETRIAPFAWIKLKNLEYLDLSHNKIIHVPSLLPKGLLYLILVHNQIERIPGFVFAHMEPGLEILYLSFNKLTSDGIDPVSFFGTYNTMRELFLDHNMLKKIPIGIAEMKALHFLRLNDNLIRNVPPESICIMDDQDDSKIRTLHLENNYINTRRIPPTAFCCIEKYSSVILTPQKVKK